MLLITIKKKKTKKKKENLIDHKIENQRHDDD